MSIDKFGHDPFRNYDQWATREPDWFNEPDICTECKVDLDNEDHLETCSHYIKSDDDHE